MTHKFIEIELYEVDDEYLTKEEYLKYIKEERKREDEEFYESEDEWTEEDDIENQ